MSQTPVQIEKVSNDVASLIQKQSLQDADGNALTVLSLRPLEKERREIYVALIPSLSNGEVIACECKPSEDLEDGELMEKILQIDTESMECNDITLECKISLDDFSPSGLIEYQFEEGKKWYLSQMCLTSFEYYKQNRFKLWRDMIEKPDCKASFRRLLRIGVINRMFDHVAFPSPENEKADWEVKDDNGRTVIIPRPIHGLRKWNAAKRAYDPVSPLLPGAPSDSEKEEFWKGMLAKFREQYGDEEIDDLLDDKKTTTVQEQKDNT